MNGKFIGALLLAGSMLLSSCGPRTEEDNANDRQPQYNANGELIAGTNTSTTATSTSTSVLSLRVISNVNSISTGGTDVANITALVTNENNNAVAGQAVVFSSTGGVLQNISTLTDDNGEASATLKLPQDFQNQDIVVTVSAENANADVKITALGSTLEVTGPATLVAGDQAELVIRLIAGNDEPIANQIIDVISTAGNSITPANAVTDPDGQVSVMIGSENSNDTVLVSALNGTVSAAHRFEVAADLLKFADNVRDAEIPVGVNSNIVVTWTSEGTPVVGRPLRFSITAGSITSPSTVTTNQSGQASISVLSSSAGPAKLSVEANDTGKPKTSVDIEFVATVAHDVSIDASTSLVNTNETSTIFALVTDALGNPVKNQEVDFNSADLKGGQLNPASAITNSAGVASVTFTAGDNATDVNAIELQSTVKGTLIRDTMQLTVFKRSLNVTLGTSNDVLIKPLGTQYAMPFIVQVADGSGTPLENATVKLSVRPIFYAKGEMVLVDKNGLTNENATLAGEDFIPSSWVVSSTSIVCPTEDINGNRLLDTIGPDNEDTNNNGSLDPQDPASLTAVSGDEYATLSGGALSSDANGSGFFELLYPASNSAWAYVEITARAEALGSESEDSFRTVLPLPSAEVKAVDENPANHISPYGSGDLDSNIIKNVIIDGITWPVPQGCATTY